MNLERGGKYDLHPSQSHMKQFLGGFGVLSLVLIVLLLSPRYSPAQDTRPKDEWYPKILTPAGADEVGTVRDTPYLPYLPDFSFAGYRWGEEPLPNATGKRLDVTDFGAVPDDGEDDTRAFRRTLKAAHGTQDTVIVTIPPGRFIVKEILFIERSNIVLRGSGRGGNGTELHFPRPLKEMDTPSGYDDPLSSGTSQFSWQGGVIWTRNTDSTEQTTLGYPVAGRRGQHLIKVRPLTSSIESGDIIQIRWFNREGRESSLLRHIYCTTNRISFGDNLYKRPNKPLVTQEVTVQEVNGQKMRIKEPLLHDLRKRWNSVITTVDYLENIGVEDVRVTFPKGVRYSGHHNEEGYNGIYFTDVVHSWISNISIKEKDSGIITSNAKNVTIEGVEIGGRRTGHYTINISNSYGVLVKDFSISSALHNPSVNTKSAGNVYTDGFVRRPRFDQHRGVNHQNLFDNITAEYSQPDDGLFRGGGSWKRWRPRAGAFNTFWNIEVNVPTSTGPVAEMQDVDNAPYARLVGVRGVDVPLEFSYGPEAYIEGMNQSGLAVPSLYRQQLERRMNGEREPSLAIFNPLQGYRYKDGESIQIEAEITGDFEATKVEFLADSEPIGTDSNGADGWSIQWDDASKGYHILQAKAVDAEGNTLRARPQSCTGTDINIWVGEEEGNLKGNYPNPFRTETTIEYGLAEPQYVRLNIYDTMGRKIKTLVEGGQRAGKKRVTFNARGLASGVYLYHLSGERFEQAGKATVIR